MSSGIHRKGDKDSDGDELVTGSSNVFVNNKEAGRIGDIDSDDPPDSMTSGSASVFVNNKAVTRIGDRDSDGPPDTAVGGSSDVFAGDSSPAATNKIEPTPAPPPKALEGYAELDRRPAAAIVRTAAKPSATNSAGPSPTPPFSSSSPGQELPQESTEIPSAAPPPGTEGDGFEEIIKSMNRAGISDPCMRAQIVAQVAHESGNFTRRTENLNYSAGRLPQVWPSRFNSSNSAEYAGNPEKLANRVYADRMGNGPESSGDGYKYRGRGFIQLTGKANYIGASRALGYDFVNNPDVAAQDPYAADLAVWYCTRFRPLTSPCDVVDSTRKINGGTVGLADRQSKFAKYRNDSRVTTLDPSNV